MPNNDYKIHWDASKFDWEEVKKRFEDKIPEKDMAMLNHHINNSFVLFSLLVNLNKRVEELEFQLKNLGER